MGQRTIELFIDYKKIPLSMNKLAPLINPSFGEQRLNTPNLQVVPSDLVPSGNGSGSGSLVKDISLKFLCQTRLSTGFPASRDSGFGAYLIDTDYESSRRKQCI